MIFALPKFQPAKPSQKRSHRWKSRLNSHSWKTGSVAIGRPAREKARSVGRSSGQRIGFCRIKQNPKNLTTTGSVESRGQAHISYAVFCLKKKKDRTLGPSTVLNKP